MKQVPGAILGRWQITWMETWDEEAINLLGPAFIEFDERRRVGVQGQAVVAQVRKSSFQAIL